MDSIGSGTGDTSIAVDSHGYAHIGYADYDNGDLKYARWNGSVWVIETVDSTVTLAQGKSIALDSNDNAHISYSDVILADLKYAASNGINWSIETVDSVGCVGGATSIAVDKDGNPHVSYVDMTNWDLKYATKAELAPPSHSVSLDIDPNTLNLKSKGRWITAYLSTENASVYDINVSSILLQDTLVPERHDYQDDILMLKFNRQELQSLLRVGDSIEIRIGGKWEDGESFEAYDYIGVINPGKK